MSTATTTVPAAPEGLEFYRLRDDFSRVYNPANPVEQMMVAQIAMSWQRLTRAQVAEQRYFAVNDILEAISKKPREYQAITRYVSDCERAWRHATLHLERMQCLRLRADLSSPNARRRESNQIPASEPAVASASSTSRPPAVTSATRAG